MSVPSVTADNGVEIPQLGLGVWQIEDGVVPDVVSAALEAGYRHIDTAAVYRNESGVGRAIAASALPREELFVTTKVWNNDQRYDATLRACDASLSRLGVEYVDLYLIHWPAPRQDRYVDTWRALEKLYADGRARSIGVSNFQVAHLRRLFDETDLRPVVNQIELHPALPQDDRIAKLAAKHGRTPAQIVLRWHLQLGNIVIPKTRTISRLAENIDVFGFELDNDDMAVIADLDTFTRTGPDPDRLG